MFVVTVIFEIPAPHVAAFREAILKNAAASLQTEEGCHRFDVCFSEDGQRCFLYELYTDADAFAVHRATAHFGEFDQAAQPLIAAKKLETFHLAANPLVEPSPA